MNKIVLEDKFITHQKITFLFVLGAPFLVIIFSLIGMSLNYKGYFFLMLLILIFIFIVSFTFSKRGFIKVNSELYRGTFVFGKLLSKKRIDISETPKITLLKFRKSQKLAWLSVANPDLATSFNSFEINILNDRHTKREVIIELKKEDNVERTLNFLTENFNLKHEIFSPDFG